MFSGRHEETLDRDASGNVFFDYSPAVMVRCVLDRARERRAGKRSE